MFRIYDHGNYQFLILIHCKQLFIECWEKIDIKLIIIISKLEQNPPDLRAVMNYKSLVTIFFEPKSVWKEKCKISTIVSHRVAQNFKGTSIQMSFSASSRRDLIGE